MQLVGIVSKGGTLMGEDNKETNQSNQTGDFKQAARDEALSAAEKGVEAAREALAAAEKKLAEV